MTPVADLMAAPPRARWSWRIGLLVLVGILGLPTIGLLGTVHLVRQAAESRARQSNAAVASAVATEVGQSFRQRVRVLESVPVGTVAGLARSTPNRAVLQADADGALEDGPYCRVTVRSPGLAPVTAAAPGACWSPPPPSTTARGVQVVGPGMMGSQAFTGLDMAVPGHPGTTLQAVFAVGSLTAFGLPGAGTHTTVVAGTTIVSSTTPALIGKVVAAPSSLAMIRAGRAATGSVFAPLIHAPVIVAYQPVPGTGLGVFFSVTTKVAYAPAAHLTRVLLLGYVVLLGIVVALAGMVLVMIRRRDRLAATATEHYRALAEATPDGVGIVDDRARLVYANPALIALLGLGPPDTWLGQRVAEWSDLSGDEWLRSRAPVLEDKKTIRHLPTDLRHTDGRRIPAEINSSPFDLDGRHGVISVVRDLTVSRAAEAAVAVAEARQRTTIETIAEGIVVFDLLDGRPVPVLMNPAAVDIWGAALEEVQEMWATWSGPELVHTDGTPIDLDDLTTAVVMRTGESSSAVYGLRRVSSEEIRWLRTTANPIRDGKGKMVGIVSSFLDVTSERAERARVEADRARYAALAAAALESERALQQSEATFRTAFEHAPIAKALIGLDGRFQQANERMCTLTGYSEAALRRLHVTDITHPDDRAAEAASTEALLSGAVTTSTLDKRYRTASGGVVWVTRSMSLVFGDDGSPLHYIAQIQDITERREHEHALADERRQLREAQSTGRVGSWEMDLTTGTVSWSDNFLQLYGLDPERFTGGRRELSYMAHPDDRHLIVAATNATAGDGVTQQARYRIVRHGDGDLRWLDLTCKRHEDGDHRRLTGTVVDVTESVLAAEQLEEARDAALEASRQKSAFLATMSHEIRTPMNAVIGMTGLLLDTPLDTDQREFVETVRTSGDSLLEIINDILDYSKIEAGGLTLENRPFELRECVEDALDLVAATSSAKGLELIGHVDERCPTHVVGDVTRLRQVLVNLLGNAVKFTARGDVVLLVDLDIPAGLPADRRDGSVALRVSVTDTGIGIPPDRLASLFESFTQVDTSTTRVYGGTGLGLAISQRLVEAMGGVLSVESTMGVGSTFAFAIALSGVAPEASVPARVRPALEGRSVLIVDDNSTSRRILRLQLEGWGMTVTEAVSGPDALAGANRSFDVALLDMQLPGMTGLELATALRARPATSQLPVILLSSRQGRSTLNGPHIFSAILTKPVRGARLEESLGLALAPFGAVAATAADRPAPIRPARDPMRVLLAEDNAVNQRLGRLMVEKLGDHVDVVGNGREAVEAVRLVPYDAVLMDVEMPEMDGLEATRAIRGGPRPDLRPQIVAMTASALVEDREACLAAGMDDYLAKPVRLADLDAALTRVAAHLMRSRAGAS